jgi:hypothetical protein
LYASQAARCSVCSFLGNLSTDDKDVVRLGTGLIGTIAALVLGLLIASDWLPAPSGDFVLMLRLYWPDESDPSIVDGSWKIPAVKKV